MKYFGMPFGMWTLFGGSFRDKLVSTLGYDDKTADEIKRKAKVKYREIIEKLPEFEKGDRFRMNIVNASLLAAFMLNMPQKPTVEQVEKYFAESMMTDMMKKFCESSGKKKFTDKDIEGMKRTAAFRAADRNPYSWNMDYIPYEDGSGYEARFYTCGICVLMNELGLSEYVPAMCRLDYTMAEAGKASDFVREYTLASGGQYCDCGYKKKK